MHFNRAEKVISKGGVYAQGRGGGGMGTSGWLQPLLTFRATNLE